MTTMLKKGETMRKLFFIALTLITLLGCAMPEKKPEEEETVFYPALPQRPRLQFLTSYTKEEDLGKKSSGLMEFLVGETEQGKEIVRPYDVAAIKGKIYISDTMLNKLLVLDLKEKTFELLKDVKEGALAEPEGLWVTEDNLIYVADKKRKQVVVYDSSHNFVRAYGKKDELKRPLDVAVYENKVYVADFDTNQIIVYDRDSGEIIQKIGELGKDPGYFYRPSHVIVDKSGNLFVTDSFNFRVQQLDASGKFMKIIGYHGDTVGGFTRPKGIAIDMEDHLYAVDMAFENVQIFDVNSTDLLLFFGGWGYKPGNMYLPNGIYIDFINTEFFTQYVDKDFQLKYLVYVTNYAGYKKLNVYGFGEWIGAPLPEM